MQVVLRELAGRRWAACGGMFGTSSSQ